MTLAGALFAGCSTPHLATSTSTALTEDYAARPPIATSLFPSDQAVLGDDAVTRILGSKLELPPKAKVAVMRFPVAEGSRYYGSYWRDEEYLKAQQSQFDGLSRALLDSQYIVELTPLPSLMTPSRVSIPVLREAAVRMQSDLLIIFRVTSDTYSQYRVFSKDRVKAYSTCEVVVLDVRTGLVPFTRVVSRDQVELKQSSDFDLTETMRRAEQVSAADALEIAAGDLVTFLKSAPKRAER